MEGECGQKTVHLPQGREVVLQPADKDVAPSSLVKVFRHRLVGKQCVEALEQDLLEPLAVEEGHVESDLNNLFWLVWGICG